MRAMRRAIHPIACDKACRGSAGARVVASQSQRHARDRVASSRRANTVFAFKAAAREESGPPVCFESRRADKHHIVIDANGTPLVAILTSANVNDVTQLRPLIDAIPPIRGVPGHPLHGPRVIYAGRRYDPSGIDEHCAIAVSSR